MFVQNYFNELFVVETGFWIVDAGLSPLLLFPTYIFSPLHHPHLAARNTRLLLFRLCAAI